MSISSHLLLAPYDGGELGVDDARVELAVHERGALVVLDVAREHGARQLDVLAEPLLLEVTCDSTFGYEAIVTQWWC